MSVQFKRWVGLTVVFLMSCLVVGWISGAEKDGKETKEKRIIIMGDDELGLDDLKDGETKVIEREDKIIKATRDGEMLTIEVEEKNGEGEKTSIVMNEEEEMEVVVRKSDGEKQVKKIVIKGAEGKECRKTRKIIIDEMDDSEGEEAKTRTVVVDEDGTIVINGEKIIDKGEVTSMKNVDVNEITEQVMKSLEEAGILNGEFAYSIDGDKIAMTVKKKLEGLDALEELADLAALQELKNIDLSGLKELENLLILKDIDLSGLEELEDLEVELEEMMKTIEGRGNEEHYETFKCPEDNTVVKIPSEEFTGNNPRCPVCGGEMEKIETPKTKVIKMRRQKTERENQE